MEPGHEDREYKLALADYPIFDEASMEPGHEDREYQATSAAAYRQMSPQWSPAMKTGNTRQPRIGHGRFLQASMEPGHEDREYAVYQGDPALWRRASMEPGHEDREYPPPDGFWVATMTVPQWSPAMKTGNTVLSRTTPHGAPEASMEPGHEDREYGPSRGRTASSRSCLNGARP